MTHPRLSAYLDAVAQHMAAANLPDEAIRAMTLGLRRQIEAEWRHIGDGEAGLMRLLDQYPQPSSFRDGRWKPPGQDRALLAFALVILAIPAGAMVALASWALGLGPNPGATVVALMLVAGVAVAHRVRHSPYAQRAITLALGLGLMATVVFGVREALAG